MARVITCRSTPTPELRAEMAVLVGRGGLLAVPTESSYALAVSPFSTAAVDRLIRVKGRPDHKPILVLIGRPDHLLRLTACVPPAAERLIARCWPGPLTMVLPAQASLPLALTAGTGTIGVRLPAHPGLRALLAILGPLTGTSANRAGAPPLMTAEAVAQAFPEEVDAVVDLGPAGGGAPSTVVSFSGRDVYVLRQGPVTREHLAEALAATGSRVLDTGDATGL